MHDGTVEPYFSLLCHLLSLILTFLAANILLGGVPEVFHFDSRFYDILIRRRGLHEQARDLDSGHLQGMNMSVWLLFNIQGNSPLRGIKGKSGLSDPK